MGTETTTYVIDTATPLTMVLAETTGTDTIRYLHGLDLVAQSDGVSTEYFAYDGLGSVRQVLDAAGLPLMTQTFDPYGNPYTYVGPTESVTSFGYSGEQTDSNGLVFLRARYYAPSMGRFMQMDPSRQERNPFVYAASNPILYTDPSGTICINGTYYDDPFKIQCGALDAIVETADEYLDLLFSDGNMIRIQQIAGEGLLGVRV